MDRAGRQSLDRLQRGKTIYPTLVTILAYHNDDLLCNTTAMPVFPRRQYAQSFAADPHRWIGSLMTVNCRASYLRMLAAMWISLGPLATNLAHTSNKLGMRRASACHPTPSTGCDVLTWITPMGTLDQNSRHRHRRRPIPNNILHLELGHEPSLELDSRGGEGFCKTDPHHSDRRHYQDQHLSKSLQSPFPGCPHFGPVHRAVRTLQRAGEA